jgi:hypothetical protein
MICVQTRRDLAQGLKNARCEPTTPPAACAIQANVEKLSSRKNARSGARAVYFASWKITPSV